MVPVTDEYADETARWKKRAFRAFDMLVATLLIVLTTALFISTIAFTVQLLNKVIA